MKFGRVKRLGLFRAEDSKTPNAHSLSVADLETKYFRPDGTNTYIGYSQLADRIHGGEPALLQKHITPIEEIGALSSPSNPGFIGINLEPNLPNTGARQQLEFISSKDNEDVFPALADHLASLPEVSSGTVIPVLRFGGEMNAGNVHSKQPKAYKACLPALAKAFHDRDLMLSFCPAINAGTASVSDIMQYFPDDPDIFDFISCTLYIRPTDNESPDVNFKKVMNLYHGYVKKFPGKRLFIDELSGATTHLAGNDAMIKRILGAIEVDVEYATLFMSIGPATPKSGPTIWGQDGTLGFLDNQGVS